MIKKPHYAWMICLATTLLFFCNIGFCSNILTVYLPFIEETGITGGQGSTMITIRSALSLVATCAAAVYYERFSVRTGALLATLLGAVSSVVYAFAEGKLALYYVASGMTGIAYAIGAALPMSILIGNWFKAKKGMAVGVSVMGSGLCNVIFTPAITAMVQEHGLKFSYLVQTAFTLLCAALFYCIVRDRPAEKGLTAYGEAPDADRDDPAAEKASRSGGSAPIGKKLQIVMLVMMLLLGMAGTAASSHVSIAAVSAGYSASRTALFFTVYSFLLIAGKFLCGTAADVLGTKAGSTIFLFSAGLGCLAACLLNGTGMVRGLLFSCLMGFGFAVFNVDMPLWAAELSAPGENVRTLKNYQIVYAVGGILFSSVPGIIADRTGEYGSSFAVCGILLLICAGILIGVYNAKEKLNGKGSSVQSL